MDSLIKRIALLTPVIICLSSCSTLPSQSFKFLLLSGTDSSRWSQSGLASSAEMIFIFQLRESIPNATDAKFSFFGSDLKNPEISIRMYDEKCTGAYEVAINYKSGAREFRGAYFKTKLTWDEESKIRVRWEDERMVVTLNDKEMISFEYSDSIGRIVVEASKGGIDANEVVYRNLKQS